MTTTTPAPIEGPDPALLTDAELFDAAMRLAAIGQEIAGTPGSPVPGSVRSLLDPATRFALDAVRVAYDVLVHENERRLEHDDRELLGEISEYLRDN